MRLYAIFFIFSSYFNQAVKMLKNKCIKINLRNSHIEPLNLISNKVKKLKKNFEKKKVKNFTKCPLFRKDQTKYLLTKFIDKMSLWNPNFPSLTLSLHVNYSAF